MPVLLRFEFNHRILKKYEMFVSIFFPQFLILFLKDTGLYYDEYLRQVIDVLETDKHFREKLQTADIEEIKVGKKQKKKKKS